MNSAKTFETVLAFRGRIVLFTATATIGLAFEQVAERSHAKVVHTRGWADSYGPVSEWHRIHTSREHGVFSCDQHRYVSGVVLPATDIVWVGDTGSALQNEHTWNRFRQAMGRGAGQLEPPRQWLLAEDAL